MQARYRSDYPGEFVVLNTIWSGGKKEQQREWVANAIENQHISGRAACIGSTHTREEFDYTRLQRHRGGLLGSKKVQTYGAGDVAHEMRLDFVVEKSPEQLPWFIETKYTENHVVYTTARNCVANPGEFYLVPHNPSMLNMTTAVYLAAFDGHSEIFLLGYNNDHPEQKDRWVTQLLAVIRAYPGVKFFLVGEPTNNPPDLLNCSNVQAMSYLDWYGYADI
jgi:hypothetical protein